jgi:cysteine desulfurase
VLEAVERAARSGFANPSSLHREGRDARSALEESREKVAARLGVRAREIVFTSGGTEANRLAILGALAGGPLAGARAVVSAIEHPSTLDLYRQLAEVGLQLDWAGAGEDGRVDPARVISLLAAGTRIVSLLHSNNETGVMQEVRPVAEACRARGIPLHCDAVQSLGKVALRPADLGADLVSLSGHKIGGPPGSGALWVCEGSAFRPPYRGGPQERGLRPGTEDLPGIVGFARAVEAMDPAGPELRDRLWRALSARVPEAVRNGDPERVLPNTLNVSFPGVSAELLLIRLDLGGVAASSGSACSSGARKPSHVLAAMGLHPARVESAVRLSLGWTTTAGEIDQAAEVIARAVIDLRRETGGGLRGS